MNVIVSSMPGKKILLTWEFLLRSSLMDFFRISCEDSKGVDGFVARCLSKKRGYRRLCQWVHDLAGAVVGFGGLGQDRGL